MILLSITDTQPTIRARDASETKQWQEVLVLITMTPFHILHRLEFMFLLEHRTTHSLKVIEVAMRTVSGCFLSFYHAAHSAGHNASILELLFRCSINKHN